MLVYESGCIGSKPQRLPLSIGDGELAETADAVVSVPEIFAYWLQAGRIDVGFLQGSQIDRHGNMVSAKGWTALAAFMRDCLKVLGTEIRHAEAPRTATAAE